MSTQLFVKEGPRKYRAATPAATPAEILPALQDVLQSQVVGTVVMDSPTLVRQYLQSKLAHLQSEVFCMLMLDSQNRILELRQIASGTVTSTTVHPRECVKAALACNASACILVHNHPSGHVQPSRADEHLTRTLKTALDLIDVRILDHIIVGTGGATLSFAERGLI